MPRATSAPARKKRRKKLFKAAKGYFGGRKNLYVAAKDGVEKGWQHAYVDRKKKKRNFRSLWIARINAAVRAHDLSYSRFINGLKAAGIDARVEARFADEAGTEDPSRLDRSRRIEDVLNDKQADR